MQFRAKLPWIRIVSKMQCVNSTHNFLSIVYVGILLERKRKKPKISMSIVTGTHIRHRSILFKQIVRGLRRWSRIKRGFWHRLQFIWSSIMNSRRIFAGHENIHKRTHTEKMTNWRLQSKTWKNIIFFHVPFSCWFRLPQSDMCFHGILLWS